MPLFYFHLQEGDDLLRDPLGRELDSLADAVLAALADARAIISADALTGIVRLDCSIHLEAAGGETVHWLDFGEAVKFIGRGARGRNSRA